LTANEILLSLAAFSFGVLAAAGVFTVLAAVGLVPRFAGKTHTANKVFLYEEMVVAGTIMGCAFSIFEKHIRAGGFFREAFPAMERMWNGIGMVLLVCFGVFSGMFIGCLALAIAEILDSIPIFSRRIAFRHGIGIAILSMSAGKLCGSLFYFWKELYRVSQ
jgi:stage V sporulation protein AB